MVLRDDVDTAIQVILRSFVESQKHSVMKAMHRVFAKYITYGRQEFDLLLFLLNTLANESLHYYQVIFYLLTLYKCYLWRYKL